MKILKTVPFALALCLGACTSSADDSDAPEASPMDAALPEVDMAPQCGPGFVPVGEDDCEDIDECAQERCPLGVECENLEGSYNCPCEGNFEVGQLQMEFQIGKVSGCTSVSGNLSIEGTDLTHLDFLAGLRSVGGNLWIGGYESRGGFDERNPALENIRGLGSLTEVGGEFWINDSAALAGLDGLQSLARVGDLHLEGCNGLPNLDGLENLTEVGGVNLSGNNGLTHLRGLSGLRETGGSLQIWANGGLTNLEGLEGLEHIDGRLRLSLNTALTSVDGLGGLRSVDSVFEMVGNNRLSSLAGFTSLATLGRDMKIKDHPNLAPCEVERLRDQVGEANIGGEIILENNTGSMACD